MCIAIAAYQNRVASVFESSEKIVIINAPSYDIKNSKLISVSNNSILKLIQLLKTNNAKTLICGAIRGCERQQIEAQNIQVIPWITGDIKNVIQAYKSNNLFSPSFLMPGCRNRGHQKRQRLRRKQFNN